MVNYQDGKIYRIVCNKTGLVYYGSTAEKNLSTRLAHHNGSYKKYINGKGNFMTSFNILENNDYDIILVEKVPCNDKMELQQRERHYIENNECVNKYVPTRTRKEYRTENAEHIKLTKKTHYEHNQENITKQKREYYEKNKEKLIAKNKIYIEANKDKISLYRKEHYEENKLEVAEKRKMYYEKNKEAIILKGKEKYENNKLSMIEKSRKYRETNNDAINLRRRENYQKKKEKSPINI